MDNKKQLRCRAIVLHYKGTDILRDCLKSLVEAKSRYSGPFEIDVLDNGGTDGSEIMISSEFPQVNYVKSPENRVLCSYNWYLKSIEDEIVILLNNDLKVDRDFIDPLVRCFGRHADAFFVAPQTLNFYSKEYEGSLSKMELRWGLIWTNSKFQGYEKLTGRAGITMQCGFGAFHRERFLELGGYDDLFLPGTLEDTDICFRAYRKGWRGYYCPESVIHHIGQATFKEVFGSFGLRRMNRRNSYLFMWKNIRAKRLVLQHVAFLPVSLVKYALFWQWDFFLGFFDALAMMPKVFAKRNKERAQKYNISDHEVFSVSRKIGT